MAYPRKLLNQNESVELDLRPHWWFLAPRLAVLVLAVLVGIYTATRDDPPQALVALVGIAVVAALIWFGVRYAQWATTNFVVTSDRVIYRHGVLSKRGIEIPLDRINTVVFNQSFFERIIGAGDLEIESAADTPSVFTDIRKPSIVQAEIYKQAEDNENRKYDRIGANAQAGAAAGSGLSIAEQLEKLEGLRDRGSITPEQYEAQKAQLLR
ncbi:MAG TPA: PH domain-containing protein [Acidimicrobiales bacterium]|nr:PH domain-containing protein [Acidimicrobiales bacterium]